MFPKAEELVASQGEQLDTAEYDTGEELQALNELYESLRLYTNFFQPVMKLVEKERIGSKVRKKYDKAKTPYKRLLQCPSIPSENKKKLK